MKQNASAGMLAMSDAMRGAAPAWADTARAVFLTRSETPASNAARFARLDALAQHRHVLLLQGPNGPFFAQLAQRLDTLGARVTKVNLNAADQWFFKGPRALAYTGDFAGWAGFLVELIEREGIDALVLFGQARPYHRVARAIAERIGLKLYVFEEGYARPWWITLEQGGVNELSMLVRAAAEQLRHDTPRAPHPASFRHAFARMAAYSAGYFAAGILGRRKFPHYVHHKPFMASEAKRWALGLLRKAVFRVSEHQAIKQLLAASSPAYFLVPLQLGNDSQILHCSPWRSNQAFIEAVITSFARHAETHELLVFKYHPLECEHADHADVIARAAQRHGIAQRVKYIHGGHLPSLLKRSRGVVLVNSTTGIQALFHGVPVCATGTAFYARPRLTSQHGMDAFWRQPVPPDRQYFSAFYRCMMHRTQINASFYAPCGLAAKRRLRLGRLAARLGVLYVACELCASYLDPYLDFLF
jgi:capsular polysaccharide export protein